jgi:hypothetical protein
VELCLACNGGSISQLLSSHRIEPRRPDIAEVDGFPAFTAEIDAEIREWVGVHGNTWTKLREHLKSDGIAMGDFPSVVLKNRWHQLRIEDRNAEFTFYRSAGFIFGCPEVIEVSTSATRRRRRQPRSPLTRRRPTRRKQMASERRKRPADRSQ